MSEDKKNIKNKEDKKDNQAENKSDSIKAGKKQDKDVKLEDKKSDKKVKDSKDEKKAKNKSDNINIEKDLKSEIRSPKSEIRNQTSELEELPEDVKKKLEKREAEKSKKGVISKKKSKMIRKKRKKGQKHISVGKAFIKSTYNNTIVTLTDLDGNVISWASAGVAGFRGPKKSTPYAAQIITRIAVGKAKEVGLSEVSVYAKGVGTGRESAIRALNSNGLNVTLIKDITPIPHNGCRKRKPRRV